MKALPTATHVITWHFKSEWYALAPKLVLLATPAAGRELVPERGPEGVTIHFGHFHGDVMAESVAAFVLGWARGFFRTQAHARTDAADRSWPRTWLGDKCYEVAGTRAVIVGYGNVGRAIGRKLKTLGVSVAGLTRHGIYADGHREAPTAVRTRALLQGADWLILALPSTTGTDGWLDAARIRQLPRRCVIANVGRGNAVDERALCAALKSSRLAGAYLDVRRHEPSATVLEVPGFEAELATLPNCILMPHAAAFTPNYVRACFKELHDDRIL